MTFRLPIRPTDIEMGYEPAAEGRGPERTLVRLTKPGFFDLSFWIEPQGSTSAVPAGLRVSDEQVKHIATHGFLITLKARFHRLRSQHWEMPEYKQWASETYQRLKARLGDAGLAQ